MAKEVKKITLGLILSWIFGILFLLAGMGVIAQGSYVLGILIMLCSAMIIPYFNKIVAEKFHFEISGGIKFVLVIVIFVLMGFAMSHNYNNNASEIGNVIHPSQNLTNPKEGVVVPQEEINILKCPDIIKSTTFEFTWGESITGNRHLYLYADFIKRISFSGNWTLDNLPSSGLLRDSFVCERGSKAGESINKLYCRPTIDYQPRIKRNIIDSQGNIIRTDYLYIKTFIFDIAGKNIQNAKDLSSLKLESIECSESSW